MVRNMVSCQEASPRRGGDHLQTIDHDDDEHSNDWNDWNGSIHADEYAVSLAPPDLS